MHQKSKLAILLTISDVASIYFLIIKFGGFLLSNLAGFYYQIWRVFIIKFGGFLLSNLADWLVLLGMSDEEFVLNCCNIAVHLL